MTPGFDPPGEELVLKDKEKEACIRIDIGKIVTTHHWLGGRWQWGRGGRGEGGEGVDSLT